MLTSGGELDGVRILSRKTVELMTSDHLATLGRQEGIGFGLGFGLGLAPDPGTSGKIVTEGTYGTCFWIDPRERLIGVILTQTINNGGVLDRLQALAYQAIDD